MSTTRTRKTLGAVLATGAISIGIIAPALAQDDATEPTSETSTTDAIDRRAEHRAAFTAALAEELGLDEATVAEAIEAVHADLQAAHRAERLAALEDRLAEAVAAGDLTQEEADAILAAAEAGVFPLRGRGHHGPGFGRGGPGPLGALGGVDA